MRPMAKSLVRFQAALAAGWIALSAVGLMLARAKGIPVFAALPVITAFLLEYPFYLAVGFPDVRARLAGHKLPVVLLISAVLPYLACSAGAIPFEWGALARLAALAMALSLWYVVLPVNIVTDAAFLLLIAFVMLGRYFETIYPEFYRQKLSILGTLALFHISALALMIERRIGETGFGFWPARRDWFQGLLHYLYFLVLGAPLAFGLKAIHFSNPAPWWVGPAMFFAFLWVVALWEEFLFRGVLQQWMEHWTWNRTAALIVTSCIFGLAHLWFRGFPNWRWAIIAAWLGLVCGHARNQTGSIRAGVVTHALVVATWRALF